ncbi:lytic murein transglycosylase [Vreelandella azerica]|uniref:lytic murein transglycosylase n=1 Tax=Vreelandella azerica TaxID=2732867 RepID=UPI002E2D149B|nr:lytic murein transglycosylase [Halomonas azerica]
MSDPERRVVPLYLDISEDVQDYRLGSFNFYVIMRYNHSHLYAMAVTELAQAIAKKAAVEDISNLKITKSDTMASEKDVQ